MMRDREQEAEDRGYVRYHCRIHGPFWSDIGPHCEQCGDPDEDEDEPEVDDDGVTDYDDKEEDTDGSE